MKHEVFSSCCPPALTSLASTRLQRCFRHAAARARSNPSQRQLATTCKDGALATPCRPPSLRAVTSSKDLKISTCISSENISTKNAMYAVLHPQTAACVRQLSPWQSTRPCKRAHGCSSSVVMSARVYPQVFVLLTDSSSPRKPSFSSITALVVHLQCTPLHAVHT